VGGCKEGSEEVRLLFYAKLRVATLRIVSRDPLNLFNPINQS
jgi:hypothetical protein